MENVGFKISNCSRDPKAILQSLAALTEIRRELHSFLATKPLKQEPAAERSGAEGQHTHKPEKNEPAQPFGGLNWKSGGRRRSRWREEHLSFSHRLGETRN